MWDAMADEELDAWRDAVRAADLADRLVDAARTAAEGMETRAVDSDQLAVLAETAADAAGRAATRAREMANTLRTAPDRASDGLAAERANADRARAAETDAQGPRQETTDGPMSID